MGIQKAQIFLVGFALAGLAITMLTFITGHLWHFPLDYPHGEDLDYMQLSIVPFFAILGNAVNYLTAEKDQEFSVSNPSLLTLLVIGPACLYILLFAITTAVFYASNMSNTPAIFPRSEYKAWIVSLLSFLACTTTALSAWVFRSAKRATRRRTSRS